ncbi:MAG: hypothetical protein Fur0037_25900 [Planctomycetota bacterium]
MQAILSTGAAAASLLLLLSLGGEARSADPGHFVIALEGTVQKLAATRAARKADPCGAIPKGLASAFAVVALDAKGEALWIRPIDLSSFDTDPSHIGRPIEVEGCVVKDWRIGLLVNVPDDPACERIEFRREDRTIGSIGRAELARLAEEMR